MDNNNSNHGWIIVLVIVLAYFVIHSHNLQSQVDRLESTVSDYSSALDEANNNIDEANTSIEDAQGTAWSSYDEMGQALDNLTAVDTVQAP